ncbi:hypothetical protein WR25_10483 [Diploscapter pachys]|uniref:hypoxia-inducible factor-proline dioxygenase n=1 Tax=Diploscapter pachys TaxID=2018661 RepID=A0A2A2JAY4_9BILA|nr:hypothetical protein WR25_10483 [Diploscapter pachys]
MKVSEVNPWSSSIFAVPPSMPTAMPAPIYVSPRTDMTSSPLDFWHRRDSLGNAKNRFIPPFSLPDPPIMSGAFRPFKTPDLTNRSMSSHNIVTPLNLFSSVQNPPAMSAFNPLFGGSRIQPPLSTRANTIELCPKSSILKPSISKPIPRQKETLMDTTPTTLTNTPSQIRKPGSDKDATPQKERIIDTDDPDIQIIENCTSLTDASTGRRRKRPTPSNSADLSMQIDVEYKDHSKSIPYSISLQEHYAILKSKASDLKCDINLQQAMILRLKSIAESVIDNLNAYGWAVVDNFLGEDHCKFTSLEIESLYNGGLFSAGQVMEKKAKDQHHVMDIRSDQIYWYDGIDKRAENASTVRLLISMIDSVIQCLKSQVKPYDIAGRSKAMIAIYPGNGTRYVKHVDNPSKDGRCITTIYYCNENWDVEKDGGNLRLYPDTSKTHVDVEPRADRLIFFWSDRRNPHEVMPVYRPRFAITIWYMDREERQKAQLREQELQKRSLMKKQEMERRKQSAEDTNSNTAENDSGISGEAVILQRQSTSSDSGQQILTSVVGAKHQRRLSSDDEIDVDGPVASELATHHTSDEATTSDGGSGRGSQAGHFRMRRIASMQSVSDAFMSERSVEREKSSIGSSENDEDIDVQPATEHRDTDDFSI